MPPPHPHSPPPGRAQGARRARGGSREHALTLTPAPEARTAWYPHTRQLRHTDTRKIHKRAGTHSRVGYAHAPQTHTRYRQFCTHTHACTYPSLLTDTHTHTAEIRSHPAPRTHSITPRWHPGQTHWTQRSFTRRCDIARPLVYSLFPVLGPAPWTKQTKSCPPGADILKERRIHLTHEAVLSGRKHETAGREGRSRFTFAQAGEVHFCTQNSDSHTYVVLTPATPTQQRFSHPHTKRQTHKVTPDT